MRLRLPLSNDVPELFFLFLIFFHFRNCSVPPILVHSLLVCFLAWLFQDLFLVTMCHVVTMCSWVILLGKWKLSCEIFFLVEQSSRPKSEHKQTTMLSGQMTRLSSADGWRASGVRVDGIRHFYTLCVRGGTKNKKGGIINQPTSIYLFYDVRNEWRSGLLMSSRGPFSALPDDVDPRGWSVFRILISTTIIQLQY